MPLVKVKPGLSHGYYDVGRQSHAYHSAGDVFDATPAELESFGDKFILVEDFPEQEVTEMLAAIASQNVDATPSGRKLAMEHGISLALSNIVGTGKDGRITQVDVQAFLTNESEVKLMTISAEAVLYGDAE